MRMKRFLAVGLLLLLVVGLVSAFALADNSTSQTAASATASSTATTASGKAAAKVQKLTDAQRADLKDLQVQMMTLQQKMIDKYQQFGAISADRANYMKDQIELQKKYAGTSFTKAMGPRGGMGHLGRRSGMMNRPAPANNAGYAAKVKKLTDAQLAELKDLQVQMLALRQKMIEKNQQFGRISADRANYMKDQIELQKKYAGTSVGAGFGGFGGRGMMRGFGAGPGMMGSGAANNQ